MSDITSVVVQLQTFLSHSIHGLDSISNHSKELPLRKKKCEYLVFHRVILVLKWCDFCFTRISTLILERRWIINNPIMQCDIFSSEAKDNRKLKRAKMEEEKKKRKEEEKAKKEKERPRKEVLWSCLQLYLYYCFVTLLICDQAVENFFVLFVWLFHCNVVLQLEEGEMDSDDSEGDKKSKSDSSSSSSDSDDEGDSRRRRRFRRKNDRNKVRWATRNYSIIHPYWTVWIITRLKPFLFLSCDQSRLSVARLRLKERIEREDQMVRWL